MNALMVLSSHDPVGNTGFWLEDFAAPYFVFKDVGVGPLAERRKSIAPIEASCNPVSSTGTAAA